MITKLFFQSGYFLLTEKRARLELWKSRKMSEIVG